MTLRDPPRDRRRRVLLGGGLGLLAAVATAIPGGRAVAAGKTAKAAVRYQFTPKGDQRCGLCASFIPGEGPDAPGACKIVEGPIPPTGWCLLFSKKA